MCPFVLTDLCISLQVDGAAGRGRSLPEANAGKASVSSRDKCNTPHVCTLFTCIVLGVCLQVDGAAGRDRSLLEAKAGKVKAKLDDALSKASAIEVAPMPKIEVR